MKKTILILITMFTSKITNAQFIRETAMDASLGFGYTFAYDNVDITDSGFNAKTILCLPLFSGKRSDRLHA